MIQDIESDIIDLATDVADLENQAETNVHEETEPNADENADPGAGISDLPQTKPKVKRNLPCLNEARLTGPRGLGALKKSFENVKFKGKGHEKEDLNLLMGTMEHWAHRLMPQMKFDDVLNKVEHIGNKRSIQNYMNRMRLGMPLEDEDFLKKDEVDDDGDADLEAMDHSRLEIDRDNVPLAPMPPNMEEYNLTFDGRPIPSPERLTPVPVPTPGTQHQVGGLTEEQKHKIEEKKRLALERRSKRLSALPQDVSQSMADTSQKPVAAPADNVMKTLDLFGDEDAWNRLPTLPTESLPMDSLSSTAESAATPSDTEIVNDVLKKLVGTVEQLMFDVVLDDSASGGKLNDEQCFDDNLSKSVLNSATCSAGDEECDVLLHTADIGNTVNDVLMTEDDILAEFE